MGNRTLNSSDETYATIMPQRMSFFSWDLAEDRLYGDEVLAELFDLDLNELSQGIAIRSVVDRIAEPDRARIAKAIHGAITTGAPYQETYSIWHRNGRTIRVIAFGRCFRSADGSPSVYAGIVVDTSAGVIAVGEDPLEVHCRSALDLAQDRGQDLVVRYLSSALSAMGDKSTPLR